MITIDNYEGYLMRYADKELESEERLEVEAFLAAHPDIAKELAEITAPELIVTAPQLSMPGKEKLLHPVANTVPLWHRPSTWRAAAAVALLILAGTVMFNFIPSNNEGTILAESTKNTSNNNNNQQKDGIADTFDTNKSINKTTPNNYTIPPTSEKQQLIASNTTIEQTPIEEPLYTPINKTVDTPVTETLIQETNQYSEPPIRDGITLLAGRIILVETDGLVDIKPCSGPVNNNGNAVRGCTIESNQLATYAERGIIGKAYDAIARRLNHNNHNDNTLIAYNN